MEADDNTPHVIPVTPPKKDSSSSVWISSFTGLGFRFDTKYNEQTGLLEAYNLGLERFQPTLDDQKNWGRDDIRKLYIYGGGGEHSEDVQTWPPGTVVHVFFRVHNSYCEEARAFLDRGIAERCFRRFEEKVWQEIEKYRKRHPDWDFCWAKQDPWHGEVLQCARTGSPRWTPQAKGSTWWLRSVVLE